MTLIKNLLENNNTEILKEASFSRLLQHMEGDFCIITAFRGENSLKKNRELNDNLMQSIKAIKCGAYKILGHWQETRNGQDWKEATPDELVDTVEESFMVPRNKDIPAKDFVKLMFELCKKYKQDGIVLVCKEEGYNGVYSKNKEEYVKFGSGLNLNKVSQAYSQWVKRKKTPFMFEQVWRPNATSLALNGIRQYGYLW